MNDFRILYQFYDEYNGADFKGFYKFYNEACEKFSDVKPEIVLDVGCGTGVLAKMMSRKFQVIGVDISPEMLSVASMRCGGKVLLLNQDVRNLELYGTVQGVVSFCDCFNYLESIEDVRKAFEKIALFTESEGIFVFDSSTKFRFEEVLNKSAFVNESNNGTLIHESNYNKKSKCLNMQITVFQKNGNMYKKYREEQKEYYHSEKEIVRAAQDVGFDLCGVFGDLKFSSPKKNDEKHYYVFRRKKWDN